MKLLPALWEYSLIFWHLFQAWKSWGIGVFFFFFFPCHSLYFWEKQIVSSGVPGVKLNIFLNLDSWRVWKLLIGVFKGLWTIFFFLIDWRNRRQNNTTMMVIMVQLLRRQGVGMGFVEWMTAFQQLGDQEREKTAAWGMWRFVWHMFPICSRLSIWGGILSMPTANCKLYLFNQIGKFKGEKKEDMPRHLGFHDPWWLSFWGILKSLWFLSHRSIPVDFIGKVVFLSLQRG